MDYEKIKQMITDMENSKLTNLELEFPDGFKIKMGKNVNVNNVSTSQVEVKEIVKENVVENKTEESKKEEMDNFKIIKSPMVGTFYSKSSPESDAYVEVGSRVTKGTVLCIIEAMKLMNEIESEIDGEIVEILVKDGEMVDYGKPLFKVK